MYNRKKVESFIITSGNFLAGNEQRIHAKAHKKDIIEAYSGVSTMLFQYRMPSPVGLREILVFIPQTRGRDSDDPSQLCEPRDQKSHGLQTLTLYLKKQ